MVGWARPSVGSGGWSMQGQHDRPMWNESGVRIGAGLIRPIGWLAGLGDPMGPSPYMMNNISLYIYIFIFLLSPGSIYIVFAQPPPPLELGGPTDHADVSPN
jgi:hypothetical protein